MAPRERSDFAVCNYYAIQKRFRAATVCRGRVCSHPGNGMRFPVPVTQQQLLALFKRGNVAPAVLHHGTLSKHDRAVSFSPSVCKLPTNVHTVPFKQQQNARFYYQRQQQTDALKSMSPDLPPPTTTNTYKPLNNLRMDTIEGRLSTFKDWPCIFLKASNLAEAGFYYTKRDDIVKCAYCGVEIGQWVQGDNVFNDHKRWSPNCSFLKKMPSNAHDDSSSGGGGDGGGSGGGEDTCGKYGIVIKPYSFPEGETCNTPRTNLHAMLIQQCKGPTYPNYAIYDNRLLSYAEWPRSIKQKPPDLADAGFFYTGKGDQTMCFQCGGGLKDWEENDDPWEQHAIWFPKCNYLLLKKSREFVDEVVRKKHAAEEQQQSTTTTTASVSTPETSTSSQSQSSTSTECTRAPESESSGESTTTTTTTESTQTSNTKEAANDEENSNSGSGSSTLCKICYSKEIGVVFLPCGHVVACVDCAPALSQCAVCRKPLEATFRAFLS